MVLVLLIGGFFPFSTGTATAAQEDGFVYEVSGSPAVANITDYNGIGGAITIPATLGGYATAYIDDYAFEHCDSLTSVVMPDTLRTIGYAAFYSCISLTSVTIGGNVTRIDYGVFYACSSLRSITFRGLVAPTSVGEDWVAYTHPEIRGHAHSASNFPSPGSSFKGLIMGAAIPEGQTAPGAPTGLMARAGTGFVLLNWTAPLNAGSPALTRYDVYRGTSSGVYDNPIGNVAAGTLSYIDTTATPGIPYYYVVKAVNSIGSSPASNQVTGTATALPSVPTVPRDVEALAGDGNVLLTWNAPASNGGSPITNYRIHRGAIPGGEALLDTIGNVLSYIDGGLTNGQTYWYEVSATNNVGESPRSYEVSALPGTAPSAPRGLHAVAGDSVVQLNWTEPEVAAPSIVTYHIFRNGSLLWSGSERTYDDHSVINGATYSYQVAASNDRGWGGNSTIVQATPFGPPSEPRGLKATAGDSLIDLDWTVPHYAGPGLLAYHLFRDGVEIWSDMATEYRDAPLTKGVPHSYKVAASNSVGWSPNSTAIQSEAQGVPDAPRDFTAIAGDGRVELNWDTPIYAGPGNLTYHLFRNGSEIWSGEVTGFTDLSVINGASYSYVVAASNSIGWGPNSTELMASPQIGDTVPTRPRGLTAISGDRLIELNWTGPSYLGPGAIAYHLFRDGSEIWSGVATAYLDSLLVKGESHSYMVAAQNSLGWGPNCTAILAAAVGVPDAPWVLTATAGNGHVWLTWNAVNYSGPGTLLYHLFRDGALVWSGSALEHDDTGIANFVEYSYQVVAENSVGWGQNGSSVEATPLPGEMTPTVPRALVIIPGNVSVTLTWEAPSYSNASALTGYSISYGTSPDAMSRLIMLEEVSCVLDGLEKGMTYFFSVAAWNSAGSGPNSSTVSATPFGVPDAPRGFQAIAGNELVGINWTVPSYSGPGSLTYHLLRDGSVIWSGDSIAHEDLGLMRGLSYSYAIRANNSVGWGPESAIVLATPYGVPSIPLNLTAVPGLGEITLNWAVPKYSGPGTLTYQLYRDGVMVMSGANTTYHDVEVIVGQSYDYIVVAGNFFGLGDNSAVVQAMPVAPAEQQDSTPLYLGIGVIAVEAVLIMALLISGKRKIRK